MSGAKTERVKKLERKAKELREELDRKEALIVSAKYRQKWLAPVPFKQASLPWFLYR
jgi:hypothetical protein